MKNKKIIKIMNKILILMSWYIVIFIIILIMSAFINIPFFNNYGYWFIVFPCVVVLLIIILCPDARLDPNPPKYLFNFGFKNYNNFIDYLDNRMNNVKLTKYKEKKDKIAIYSGTLYNGDWREYYVVFKFKEIKGLAEDVVSNMFKTLDDLTKDLKDVWRCRYHYIFFVCVEKENEVFHEIINNQWTSTDDNVFCFLQIVGCSFEKKIMYITLPKMFYYRRSDQFFLLQRIKKIMKLKRKERIK